MKALINKKSEIPTIILLVNSNDQNYLQNYHSLSTRAEDDTEYRIVTTEGKTDNKCWYQLPREKLRILYLAGKGSKAKVTNLLSLGKLPVEKLDSVIANVIFKRLIVSKTKHESGTALFNIELNIRDEEELREKGELLLPNYEGDDFMLILGSSNARKWKWDNKKSIFYMEIGDTDDNIINSLVQMGEIPILHAGKEKSNYTTFKKVKLGK